MNTKKWLIVGSIVAGFVVVVLVAALTLVPAVLAQGPVDGYGYGPGFFGRGGGPGQMFNNQTGFGPRMGRGGGAFGPMFNQGFNGGFGRGGGPMFGMGPRWGGPENSLVAVAAEQLGMERTDLIAELQGGKSIAQVAEEKGVAVETIVEAFLAARTERLNELVENGQLTREQADAMLTLMRAEVTEHINEAGLHQGRGPGFVDENGDGVCDHADGIGQQFGRRGGPGWRWTQ